MQEGELTSYALFAPLSKQERETVGRYLDKIDVRAGKRLASEGSFAWGGAASTAFWVDPREEITAVFLTQLLPSSTHPIRPQLQQLVSQALVD